MRSIPKVSEAEWEIMKVIWKQHPITAEHIVLQLPADNEWSDRTVRTFINRLLQKKAIGFERIGRSYQYFPLVSEADCVKAESRSFLKRVFDGAAGTLVTNFLEEAQLSPKEIEQLQQILKEKQEKNNDSDNGTQT